MNLKIMDAKRFFKKLLWEKQELSRKIQDLENVLTTEGFREEIGEEQYNLMYKQIYIMLDYFIVLSKRLELLTQNK